MLLALQQRRAPWRRLLTALLASGNIVAGCPAQRTLMAVIWPTWQVSIFMTANPRAAARLLNQVLRLLPWLCLMLLGNIAAADQTLELRVTATIPPRPCQYPDRCKPLESDTATKVVVENGVIHYLSSVPTVTKTDDMLTVLF